MPALKKFFIKGENIREENPVERKKDIPFFLFLFLFLRGWALYSELDFTQQLS